VLLIGGLSSTPGLSLRIKFELSKDPKLSNLTDKFAYVPSPFQKNLLPWIGASLIGRVAVEGTNEVSPESFAAEGVPDWTLELEK
jgi:actin-related protein